ncbi:MAG: hypothetical protein ACRECQ_04110, partial [Burkholderiaceae bacterium]
LDALRRELSMLDAVYTQAYVAAVFAVTAGFNTLGRAQKMCPLLERSISMSAAARRDASAVSVAARVWIDRSLASFCIAPAYGPLAGSNCR